MGNIFKTNCKSCKKSDFAALNGHLDCLKFLHNQEQLWDVHTCEFAALNGHLDCLQYAHTHGYPWNERTCAYCC
jgi:hypothetical protein